MKIQINMLKEHFRTCGIAEVQRIESSENLKLTLFKITNQSYFWMIKQLIKFKLTMWINGQRISLLAWSSQVEVLWIETLRFQQLNYLFSTLRNLWTRMWVGWSGTNSFFTGHLLMIHILFQYSLLSLKVLSIWCANKATIIY